MRIFGIDPGSNRTGYGCVETDGSRHCIVTCGAISAPPLSTFPAKLLRIHSRLTELIRDCHPDCHARGVAMLAAVEAGVPVVEYTPAEIKRAVVGYGRAEKPQVQQMVKVLLGLASAPAPHDAADALAVAICHAHSQRRGVGAAPSSVEGRRRPDTCDGDPERRPPTGGRDYRPARS
ncbi:MAG: hypothetical protein AUJ01_03350 [Acidobacteria bacterium 13_1_40CM_3_65_5]|nr:MAG: hypothetical protein AUJ01_03350 [Acidobacteria bacterium 13_1_40CM_3_65_5]